MANRIPSGNFQHAATYAPALAFTAITNASEAVPRWLEPRKPHQGGRWLKKLMKQFQSLPGSDERFLKMPCTVAGSGELADRHRTLLTR